MVDYNPNRGIILGQEWVPIRDVSLQYGENINAFEQGHGFTLTQATALNNVRFYVHEQARGIFYNQAYTVNIYPQATFADAGPVRRVVIPVNSGSITGAAYSILSPNTTVAQALFDPTKYARGIQMDIGSGNAGELNAYFDVNRYAQLLNGKRILGVNFLANWRTSTTPVVTLEESGGYLTFGVGSTATATNTFVFNPPVGSLYPPQGTRTYTRYRLGDVGFTFGQSIIPGNTDVIPWTYTELQKFEATSATPFFAVIESLASADVGQRVFWNYLAMEVFYCEETRIAFGTKIFNRDPMSVVAANLLLYEISYTLGANPVTMFSLSGSANPILQPGDYYVTLSQASMGDNRDAVSNGNPTASINALRQYYSLSSLPATRILLPYPLDESIVDTVALDAEDIDVLPQLSLHASGSALTAFTAVHPYGRQVAAQVWGNQTVRQDVEAVGVTGSYPQIRFIARRWCNTSVSLTVTTGGGWAASTASIAPADFDELSEIVDGWKEVTLTLSPTVSPGASSGTVTWSATGETAGNRWEVLGAASPALSGIPGNLFNLAPTASQLYNATYQPPAGATYDLDWMPQGITSPYVSGAAVDDGSDAYVVLSTQPPAVSGFAVLEVAEPLEGIGQKCGLDPCGIPTDVLYHDLTWSPPASGYSIELQRMDDYTDWQTIMLASDHAVSGFRDYEARVGVESSYRIRTLNVYEFEGPWSDTITNTLTSPGVSGGVCGEGDAHFLIFTSNVGQDGQYTLAYSSVWEGRVQEDFTFPEAGFTQLQAMYDRDFFVAFRPRERGGDQFVRNILVQAAAISPLTLPGFDGISDLAWADLPYVCVRDEDGNRWFASINVPTGQVQLNRSIYIAQVGIAEVTDTAAPVDP